jgi:uncharacterized RDD family membrane protein YckC
MYCPQCNGQIPDDSKFCPMCGATLLQPVSQAAPPPPPVQQTTPPPMYTQPQQPYGAPPPGQQFAPPPNYGPTVKPPPAFGNGMPYAVGAGVGIRFAATLIDFIIFGVINFIVTALFGTQTASYDSGVSFDASVTGLPALLLLAFGIAYYLVMETMWGATVGKMVCGLKVVMQDGSKVEFVPVLLRYVLRIVDALPGCIPYLVGAIFIWNSPYNQRFGDKIAKTLVVKSRGVQNFAAAGNDYFGSGNTGTMN